MSFDILMIEKNGRNEEDSAFSEAAKKLGVTYSRIDPVDVKWSSSTGFDLPSAKILVVRSYKEHGICQAIGRHYQSKGSKVFDESLFDQRYTACKILDHYMLAEAGIAQPETIMGHPSSVPGHRIVAKTRFGFGGMGVHLAETSAEAFSLSAQNPSDWFFQEYIPGKQDFRVYCIGYKAWPHIIVREASDGFKTNNHMGGKSTVMSLDEFSGADELFSIAEAASRTLGREFSAVDLVCDQGTYKVLEVNKCPRFRGIPSDMGIAVDAMTYWLRK